MSHCALVALLCLLLPLAAPSASGAERPPPEALRADLADILAGPEYHQPEASWLREMLRKALAWLRDQLRGWWLPGVDRLREAWPALYWAIVAVLAVLLGLLVWHIGLTLSLAFRERKRPAHAPPVGARAPDPDALLAQAAQLARRGRYREAVVLLHESLLHFLDRRGVVRFDPSRTNWELAGAAPAPALRDELTALAARLDALLYGAADADAEEYRRCAEIAARAREAVS